MIFGIKICHKIPKTLTAAYRHCSPSIRSGLRFLLITSGIHHFSRVPFQGAYLTKRSWAGNCFSPYFSRAGNENVGVFGILWLKNIIIYHGHVILFKYRDIEILWYSTNLVPNRPNYGWIWHFGGFSGYEILPQNPWHFARFHFKHLSEIQTHGVALPNCSIENSGIWSFKSTKELTDCYSFWFLQLIYKKNRYCNPLLLYDKNEIFLYRNLIHEMWIHCISYRQTIASERVGNSRPRSAGISCRSSVEYKGKNQSNFLLPKTCNDLCYKKDVLQKWRFNKQKLSWMKPVPSSFSILSRISMQPIFYAHGPVTSLIQHLEFRNRSSPEITKSSWFFYNLLVYWWFQLNSVSWLGKQANQSQAVGCWFKRVCRMNFTAKTMTFMLWAQCSSWPSCYRPAREQQPPPALNQSLRLGCWMQKKNSIRNLSICKLGKNQ
jgi:hypothetical protein